MMIIVEETKDFKIVNKLIMVYKIAVFYGIVSIYIYNQIHINLTLREQRKIRCLERDSNSHLRVSRPPLYQLSDRANWDW